MSDPPQTPLAVGGPAEKAIVDNINPATESSADAVPPPTVPPTDHDHENDTDYDSTYGDGDANSTASVSSSIRHYREVHGRTYHNYGNTEYWGPNDEAQNEQLDIGHHMCTLVLNNKLYKAPLDKNIQKALDIGTGTGIWAIDFADEFPSAEVIGTDISPIQPSFVPSNLQFQIDDAQLEWTYTPASFDYIHLRCLMGSISSWPLLYSRAFAALKPGAYIEHFEMDIQFTSDDGTVVPGVTMYDWSTIFIDAGVKMGRTFTIGRDSKRLLEEAGFVDVSEEKFKLPVGPWMREEKWKEIGKWDLLFLSMGLEGMAMFIMTHVLGWEYIEVQVLLAKMRKDIMNPKLHGYYEMTLTIGRKPE